MAYLDNAGLAYFFGKLKAIFATKDVATTSAAGLMSATDKAKIDSIIASGIGVLLFNNDNNSLSGAITLSETAANFVCLTICYKTNDDEYASVDVYNPNGKLVNLSAVGITDTSTPDMYLKSKTVQINGTSIDTYKGSYYKTAQLRLTNNSTPTRVDYVGITQVIGYRDPSEFDGLGMPAMKHYSKGSTSYAANSAYYADFTISGFSSITAVIPYFESSVTNGGAPGNLSISLNSYTTTSVRCLVHNAGSSAVSANPHIVVFGTP